MKIFLTGLTLLIAVPTLVHSAPLVTPNQAGVAQDQDYYTQDVRNTRLIFTEENRSLVVVAVKILFLIFKYKLTFE